MDRGLEDPVVITGSGHVVVPVSPLPLGEEVGVRACDPMPYLRAPKLRKYMGVQDDLAVIAAARAVQSADLGDVDPERIGLFLVVGYIPFERADLDPLLAASLENGAFSMERFSTAGFRAVNGLLTFRCLPNMPAFHVSVNCNIQGPYFVTYPGPAQFYLALEEAQHTLRAGSIDVALVAGVAHQRNFLVEYHYSRIDEPVPADTLRDAAGCIVMEKYSTAMARHARVRGELQHMELRYRPHQPFADAAPKFYEVVWGSEPKIAGNLGAASLPVALSNGKSDLNHSLMSRDGLSCTSSWSLSWNTAS